VPPWPVASPQLKLKTCRCPDLGHLVPSRLLWRVLWPSPSAVGDCRCCGTCRGKTSHAPGASSWGCSSTQHPASSTPPRGPQKPYVRAQEFAQAPASFFHHWSMVGNGNVHQAWQAPQSSSVYTYERILMILLKYLECFDTCIFSRAVSAPCQLCTRGYRSTVTKSTIF
jgi:hypothetical protein